MERGSLFPNRDSERSPTRCTRQTAVRRTHAIPNPTISPAPYVFTSRQRASLCVGSGSTRFEDRLGADRGHAPHPKSAPGHALRGDPSGRLHVARRGVDRRSTTRDRLHLPRVHLEQPQRCQRGGALERRVRPRPDGRCRHSAVELRRAGSRLGWREIPHHAPLERRRSRRSRDRSTTWTSSQPAA